jgi:polyisoprenyl-phosphate glycosyltransferase
VNLPPPLPVERAGVPHASSATERISVVVPLYRCEACIAELYRRVVAVLEGMRVEFELILVNDGSPDGDWRVASELARRDQRVKAVNLSRNFGQHYAISAGLDVADGDWVVVMDGDLQDPPEGIASLHAKAKEGHDIVFGRKPQRSHSPFKRLTSLAFTWLLGFLMGERLDNAVTHFSIVSRAVAVNARRFREHNRSYAFLLRWLGFDVAYVEVRHDPRFAGEGAYTLGKLLRLAFELVVSQSDKPLRMSIGFGFFVAALAFVYGAFMVVRYFTLGTPVEGWTSLIASLYFLGGLGFVALGVTGLYVGRIFEETKGRPLYVVKETVNVTNFHSATGGGGYNAPEDADEVRHGGR